MRLKVSFGNFGGGKEESDEKSIGLDGMNFVSLKVRVAWGLRT